MSEEYYLDELETETEIQKKDIVILHQEIERLTKVEQDHQRINGELRKENDRLNNIIKELKKYIEDTKQDGYKLVWINEYKNYFEAGIEEILGSDKE